MDLVMKFIKMSNLNEFTSLDKEEQLNILKELSDPNLSDHETEVMNYLRTHTLYETIEYFAEQKLQEYLKHSEILNTKTKERQEILSYLTSDSYSVDPAQLIKDIEDARDKILKTKAHFYISKDSSDGKQSKCKILGFLSKNLNEIDEFLYNYPDYNMIVYLYESPDTCKLLKLIDSTNTPVFKKGGRLCHYSKKLKM